MSSQIETIVMEGCQLRYREAHMTVTKLNRKTSKATLLAFERENPPDVTLNFGDSKSVKAHKQVLKEYVPYFMAMFSENFQESSLSQISLGEEVELDAVQQLMKFIYKGTLLVRSSYAQPLFQLADQWGMTNIKEICSYFMTREMDTSNCLDLWQLSEIFSCQSLAKACEVMIAQEFPAISCSSAFLELSHSLLARAIQLSNINLGPHGEDFLVNCIMTWIQHKPDNRIIYLADLSQHLHWPSVSANCKEKWKQQLADLSGANLISVVEPRLYRQRFMVFCGYLQSRTGSSCPRTSEVEEFNPDSHSFERLKALPEVPSYLTTLNLYGKIVLLSVTVRVDADEKRYDVIKVLTYRHHLNLWKEAPEMFSEAALDSLKSCLVNEGAVAHCALTNKIYAVSIKDGVCIKVSCTDGDIHCDIDSKLPNLTSHLEESHSAFQAVCHQGRLYFLGGAYGPLMERVCSDAVLCLSEDGTMWEQRASMLMPRTNCAAVVLGDSIYVTGGYGGHEIKRRQQSCEVYNVRSDSWHMYTTLKQSRSHHCTVAADNKLYTIGGKSYASQKRNVIAGWHPGGARIVSDYVEVSDPSSPTCQWERIGRMTKSRCHFSALVI